MDAHEVAPDKKEGRVGQWIHTSLGGRFFPADPRPEEVFISDIANGLALDCRYAGQGRTDRYYSVAEHCVLMTRYAQNYGWPLKVSLAVLLHDAAEAYINDLAWPAKAAVGTTYAELEKNIQVAIWDKFKVNSALLVSWAETIKELDCRMITLEKAVIMAHLQPWAHDKFVAPEGITIQCWNPCEAKKRFLEIYEEICLRGGFPIEGYEL